MSEQNLVDAPDQFGGDGFEVEEFDGGNEGGGPVAPGMGQSKSSRRRRRKRKNKLIATGTATEGGAPGATEDAGTPPTTIVMEGESLALAAGAAGGASGAAAASGNAGQALRRPQPGGQQFGQGQGGKRWKKKFRDRERRTRSDNPGNDARAENPGNSGGGYGHGNGGYGGGNGYRQNLPDNFGNLAGGFKRKNK